MKTVQRGNRQLRVADDRVEELLRSGWSEVDERTGRTLRAPAGTDAAALKKEIAALKKENKELRAQVEALTMEGTALKKENKELCAQVEGLAEQVKALTMEAAPADGC